MSRFFLPELPKEWATDKLGNLVDIVYGEPLPAEKRNSLGNVPVYSSGGIIGTHDQSLYSESSIIIGRKGTVGSVFFTSKPFWCIDTAFYLRNIQKPINIEFLTALLKFIDLSNLKIVVGVPGVNRKDLENLTIPLPPLSEQNKIVEMLREVDDLIQLRKQSDKKLNQFILASFIKIFGNPDPRKNEKGWEIVKLGDYVEVGTGGTPDRNNSANFGGEYS